MRALRDFNTPKIVTDDMPIFMGLIGDLFPALKVPRKRDMDFEETVKKSVIVSLFFTKPSVRRKYSTVECTFILSFYSGMHFHSTFPCCSITWYLAWSRAHEVWRRLEPFYHLIINVTNWISPTRWPIVDIWGLGRVFSGFILPSLLRSRDTTLCFSALRWAGPHYELVKTCKGHNKKLRINSFVSSVQA